MTGAGQLWSWALTAVGVLGIYLAGRRSRAGWAVGLGAQALWIAYAVASRQWGFIVSALAYGTVYGRNWHRWRRESTTPTPTDRTEHRTVTSPAPRPDMDPPYAEVYDWLALNGIDEWVPEGPTLEIRGDRLTYTAFVWSGPRGWSGEHIATKRAGEALVERRTVPLVAPLTDRLRELLAAAGWSVTEHAR